MTESEKPAENPAPGATPEARPVQLGEVPKSGPVEPLAVNIAPLMDVPLKVSVLLGETRMSLGDLLR
ncbi:MAG TPA: hypothetical protein PKC50_01185, partial [Elusimicrobiota bacterium]|nr:hypothetical protein [Elusimicrobiota bacterium]